MSEGGGARSRGPRPLVWAAAVLFVLVATGVFLFLAWALDPHRAEPGPLERATALPNVDVTRGEEAVTIAPAGDPSGVGVVFYPGARVEADAYVASWAPVVEATGVTVIVPDLRLNLALLDRARAESVVGLAPDVETWYLGGHSMGGAFAARHLADDTDVDWAGLVLWASYATESAELSDRDDLRVLSVAGGRDGLLSPDEVEGHRPALPDSAVTMTVEGMNHAQFGAYGDQPGDGRPEITDEEARMTLASTTADFLVP